MPGMPATLGCKYSLDLQISLNTLLKAAADCVFPL